MSIIDNIEIKNFKSIRHQKIEGCKRVNVFIGEPNVGKSNILEGIGLYSFTQHYNGENFLFESICRFNHLSDLNYDKNIDNEIHIGINKRYELFFNKNHRDTFFELCIAENSKKPYFFTYNVYKEINKVFSSPIEKNEVEDKSVYSIKYYAFDKNADFKKVKSYSLSIPSGDNLLDILHGNSELRKVYSELLSINNLKLNISDTQISIAKELSDGTFVSFSNNMVADTLRRLFFYKAAIKTNSNSVLLFEEPEAHMYPPYISKFTSDMMYDDNGNQFFIATHSPYVINDIMENLKKDDYSIYTVGYDKENGETLIRRMTDEELHEIYQYGVDLFLNLENYLPHAQQQ